MKQWKYIIPKIKPWNILPPKKNLSKSKYAYLLSKIYHNISYKNYKKKIDFVISSIKQKNYSILDFGGGNGNLLYFLSNKKFKNLYYFDINIKSYYLSDKIVKKTNIKNISKLKDNSIDIIYCDSVLQFLDTKSDVINTINQFIRIAKKKVIILDIKDENKKEKFIKNKIKRLNLAKKKYDKIYKDVPYIFLSKKFLSKKLLSKNINYRIANSKSFQFLYKYSFNLIITKK